MERPMRLQMEEGFSIKDSCIDFSPMKTKRSTRNKNRNRRITFGVTHCDEKRPAKRLFTPEIKKYLKDWLVRRRDNPYPNRDEKKILADSTGLTYIQVCNWFANWRRKLKNAGKEPQKKTWGHLIKTYNSQVHGNVEHFSISSEDSIWRELDHNNGGITSDDVKTECMRLDDEKRYFPSSENRAQHHQSLYLGTFNCEKNNNVVKPMLDSQEDILGNKPSMITRWLESAAKFKPSEHNYLYYYDNEKTTIRESRKLMKEQQRMCRREIAREELDAAEALTTLANAMSHC